MIMLPNGAESQMAWINSSARSTGSTANPLEVNGQTKPQDMVAIAKVCASELSGACREAMPPRAREES